MEDLYGELLPPQLRGEILNEGVNIRGTAFLALGGKFVPIGDTPNDALPLKNGDGFVDLCRRLKLTRRL